ncbi:MAG: RluA family pseudouridine synthase [Rickettsiales bacterium]|jgi:23S rRNA pseudouridine1911/1915/1917 synthase|nr:RluA family pseudouridine synthase [Rickettsiales bacterium]
MKIFSIVVSDDCKGKRLDKFLAEIIGMETSRNRIQNIIKNDLLKKNGEIFNDASYKIQTGNRFDMVMDDVRENFLKETDIPLDIVYEDDDLIIINKQAGLSVHPGGGDSENTLVNALLFHRKDALSGIGGALRPGIVHRLDKDTTGLMAVAKNDVAHRRLAQQLKDRRLKRIYWAFVWGKIMPAAGTVEGFMEKSKINRLKMVLTSNEGAKYSATRYRTLENFSTIASLAQCELDTGRTHQIRVHLSSKKCPVIGDRVYGGNARKIAGTKTENTEFVENFPRQALHSKKIFLIQPSSGQELGFETDLPDDMAELKKRLRGIEAERKI